MNEEEFEEWLTREVADSFMDIFYYKRKECEEMPLERIQDFEKNGMLTEEMLKRVFNKQIEKEFN